MQDSRSFFARLGLASVSVMALASCGASSNSAPVVYGTEPATGRIYNSPAEIYLERPQSSPTSLQQPGVPIQAQSNAPLYQGQSQNQAQPQGVRIYNAPPSATIVQAPVQQVPVSAAPLEPVTGGPVRLDPYNEAPLQQPVYRGLPPSPTYINSGQRTAPAAAPLSGTIIVQPGDTIYAISRRTGYRPSDIIAVNNMVAPYSLSIGQVLRLPVSAQPATQSYQGDVSRTISYAPETYVSETSQVPLQPTAAQPAPIDRQVIARDVLYTVTPGDTLYSIARTNGITVQSIASTNRIAAPYSLSVGQQLLLPAVPVHRPQTVARAIQKPVVRQQAAPQPRPVQTVAAPRKAPVTKSVESLAREASYSRKTTPNPLNQFQWPVQGSVIANYGAGGIGRRNEGINIAAPQGTTIRAAADGEVVYRGSEIDGYGNMLLIKHNGGFVTAYAHNDVMLVRKGQKVKKGQIIGKVGRTGSVNEPQLHFEIRQNLKSVDPLRFLASN